MDEVERLRAQLRVLAILVLVSNRRRYAAENVTEVFWWLDVMLAFSRISWPICARIGQLNLSLPDKRP